MVNASKHRKTNENPFVMFLKEGKSFNPEDTTFDSDRINFKFKSEEELYDLITEIDSSNSIAEAKNKMEEMNEKGIDTYFVPL